MTKMKVMQVVGSLRMGGLELVALNYFKYIDRTKYTFDYLVYGSEIGELEKEVKRLGGNIIRIPKPKKNPLSFFKHLKKVFQDYGPYDVVHSHPLFNSGIVLKAAKSASVPIRISHSHSARQNERHSVMKNVYIKLMKYNLHKYSTHFLACSNEAGNYLFGSNWFSNKGIIMENGINISDYRFNKKKRYEVRKRLSLNDYFVIGNVGRLSNVKNQKYLLDIFKDIKSNDSNVKLLLVGEGMLREELEMKVKELNISEDVIFLGSRNDVSDLLQAMDIFVFPSKSEGFGIAVVEAQASGLPCLISDVIPKDAIATDLVVSLSLESDAKVWSREILKIKDESEESRARTDDSLVSNTNDLPIIIRKIEDIYCENISKRQID